jgi:hypothetical protein
MHKEQGNGPLLKYIGRFGLDYSRKISKKPKGVRVIGYDNAEGKGDHRHFYDYLIFFVPTLQRSKRYNALML